VVRVMAQGNQARAIRAEAQCTDPRGVAARHCDFPAALAIPEAKRVGTPVGPGCDPLAIGTVSQVPDRLLVGAQDSDRAALRTISNVHGLSDTNGNPFAVRAEDDRKFRFLPFHQDGDLLASGRVPQPARAGSSYARAEGDNPAAVRVVRQEEITIQLR